MKSLLVITAIFTTAGLVYSIQTSAILLGLASGTALGSTVYLTGKIDSVEN